MPTCCTVWRSFFGRRFKTIHGTATNAPAPVSHGALRACRQTIVLPWIPAHQLLTLHITFFPFFQFHFQFNLLSTKCENALFHGVKMTKKISHTGSAQDASSPARRCPDAASRGRCRSASWRHCCLWPHHVRVRARRASVAVSRSPFRRAPSRGKGLIAAAMRRRPGASWPAARAAGACR